MLFLFVFIFTFGLTYLCRKIIKKYAVVFYITAVILSVCVICIDSRGLPSWINTYIIELLSRGILSTALWCVVMWTGAFPNGSKAIKAFLPIRGELSIFAALLTLGHNIGYGKIYFVWLFTESERMSKNQIAASILTLMMLTIMIPLTILSFPKVRKKMKPKRWKRIQRFAYLFYAMIYLHVLVLCIPLAQQGREGYLMRIFVYSGVFISYGICRIRKWLLLKGRLLEKKALNRACAGITVILVGFITAFSKPEKMQAKEVKKDIQNDVNQETVPLSAYKDGTYTASAFGYDGDVEITIVIENGRITKISGTSGESDTWYYETAKEVLFQQILMNQNSETDAVSGATYSSKAIIGAAEKALEEAKEK